MASVTGRIAEIKQPRGGYIKPSEFEATFFDDDIILNDDENVHSSIVGMTVDYLTRFSMRTEIEEAFKISLQGAKMAESLGVNNALHIAKDFSKRITGLVNIPRSIEPGVRCKRATIPVITEPAFR